ncbi:RidA family protein, partial [Enterococcus faecalis]
MTNKIINSAQAPAAVGRYSHSVLAGNTLYICAQLGLDA